MLWWLLTKTTQVMMYSFGSFKILKLLVIAINFWSLQNSHKVLLLLSHYLHQWPLLNFSIRFHPVKSFINDYSSFKKTYTFFPLSYMCSCMFWRWRTRKTSSTKEYEDCSGYTRESQEDMWKSWGIISLPDHLMKSLVQKYLYLSSGHHNHLLKRLVSSQLINRLKQTHSLMSETQMSQSTR